MKNLISFILLVATSSMAYANPELKGHPEELRQFLHPEGRIVSIYASAEEKAYADKAIISLVITTEDKNLSDSISKNRKLREVITERLVGSGINQGNIKSSNFSTSPQYGWFGNKPDSYKVVNRMAISITEENQLKEIAAVADRHGQVEFSDTTFEHSRKDEVEARVKEQALAKVMKQKEFYEKALGIKLVPVGFREDSARPRATRGALALEERVLTDRKLSSSSQDFLAGISSHDSAAEPSFDEVKYQAGISVDFKIEGDAQ